MRGRLPSGSSKGPLGAIDRIDPLIEAHSANWRLARMPVVDRIVLRLARLRVLHEPGDADAAVIIDEALELTKRFSTPEAAKFINGVLDGDRRKRLAPRHPAHDV